MNAVFRILTDSEITTIDQKIIEWLNNWTPGGWPWGNFILCSLAIILTVILCGLVGFEREKRGRSAGLRTHLLVGVGSCIIMIISIYGFPAVTNSNRDVARLAAGVIAGVGFLGAGAIIHYQGGIKGLTTAGTIWLVMAIGLACGSMNFVLAIFSTLVVIVVLIAFRRLERAVTKNSPTIILLTPEDVTVLSILLRVSKDNFCTISDINSVIIQDGNLSRIETTFKLIPSKKEIDLENVIELIGKETKAVSMQVVNHH